MTVHRIQKVLVANRGEIARRVMRTCRDMGIATVAVFSDADADALFVREADEAVRIGAPPSVESYLRIDRLLAAAKKTGADAVHPGYGFLSENAKFAEAVIDAGLVFIGPTPAAISAMGSKKEAKRIVAEAGVPVVPGYDGADQDPKVLAREARKIGFPVLLKASAGGGGKGMRVAREGDDLDAAIASAKREAEAAFGDGTLLVEKYVDRPRHVEIQILGDTHGTLLHLFERECSIQRRHQKIIEESPSPALTGAMREQMGEAAVMVGRAIGYTNAGTVEMILGPDGSFYFLEVNTRLQVEHPVTEMVTGVDLVHEQIRVAQGEPLGYTQADLAMRGAALECRIYAEDPDDGFLPQSGRLVDFHVPDAEGLRVDGGVARGSDVSIHYDPMLAKIVTHGRNRHEAIQRMVRTLRRSSIQGIRTNKEFLLHVLGHPAFVQGDLDTHFIDTHLRDVLGRAPAPELVRHAAISATLAEHEARRASRPGPRVPSGFRTSRFADQWVEWDGPLGVTRVTYRSLDDRRFRLTVDDHAVDALLVSYDADTLSYEDGEGVRRTARVVLDEGRAFVSTMDGSVAFTERPRFPEKRAVLAPGACVAPMPGKVIAVEVAEGDAVVAGQVLLVMEAMKMEHAVKASESGSVSAVRIAAGDQVEADQLLVVVEPA